MAIQGPPGSARPAFESTNALRFTAVAEVTAMLALLLSYIWLWQGTFPGNARVVVFLYFALGYASHRRRGESARDIGLRLDNWRPATRDVAGVVALGTAVPLAWGVSHGTMHFELSAAALPGLVMHVLWGTAQQYGLLCFFYRRLCEILAGPRAATFAAAAIFAICHLPNVFLIAVTFAAGLISCTLYRRHPNVFVLGAAHALISLTLFGALPFSMTHHLLVGPGYYSAAG